MSSNVPPGALDAFRDFINHHQALSEVMELATHGISIVRAMPEAAKALAIAAGDPDFTDEHRAAEAERARRFADLAQREVDAAFPLISEHVTLSAWSAMEAAVREFVAQWIMREPSARQIDKLRKIK